MVIKTLIKKSTYFDSVSLMALSTKANKIEGVCQAVIAMGAELNKDVLRNVGLYTDDVKDATPGDLMIVVSAENEEMFEKIYEEIDVLMKKKEEASLHQEAQFSSFDAAVKKLEGANLAIISVPGVYAFREAKKALNNNVNAMLFSDNVSIEQEVALKQLAHEKGLLVMGPDCGTAILGGKGLCFANSVRRGDIGIIGASGTGSQEVSVRIHDFGGGVSHLIGTGGRDLSAEVGGITMLDSLEALESDPETKVILLLSKQPAQSVAAKIYEAVRECKKPVVICFLGGNREEVEKSGAVFAKTTEEAALKAVELSGLKGTVEAHPLNMAFIEEVKGKLKDGQKYIRGLYCGGTLCDESARLVSEKFSNVYSNISKDPNLKLKDVHESKEHTFIDFGDDEFTKGRPHPMIDPSLRIERFYQEARDKEVAVIVLDFELGYGSHPDPIGVMIPAIKEIKEELKNEGRHLEILAYVLGTDKDAQDLESSVKQLEAVGVTVASSSVNTGLLAREFVSEGEKI